MRPFSTLWLAVWSFALFLLSAVSAHAARSAPEPSPAYGQFPLYFEANHGQTDARFHFIARGQRHALYLAPAEAALALVRPGADEARVLTLNLIGANPRAAAAGSDPLPGLVNYFLGRDPAHWQTAIPAFARVRFASVYPGIDLVYHSAAGQLEYDFIVAPGADPRAIALRFDGADSLRLGADGQLILEAGEAKVFQHRPVVYQDIAGVRREIAGRYERRDARTVAFAVGRYDTNHPLVIDPILSYSTFLGGSSADTGWAIAVDAAGAAFVAGETLSVFKTVPASGFQTNLAGGNGRGGDAFVAKLNPAGTAFEFLTYLGGKGLDGAVGLALDAAGQPYVTGYTTSADFPVTPGVGQPAQAGKIIPRTPYKPSDAFITKFNATGSALLYSTYLGGSGNDSAFAIAVDAAGSAHVAGYTETAGDYRVTNRVCKARCTNDVCAPATCRTTVTRAREYAAESVVTNILSSKITGTNVMGTNVTYEYTVVSEVIVTTLLGVYTYDPGFPATNAVQPFNSGRTDAFVAKLNPDASALVYSTLLGGFDDEQATGLAVDAAGNAFVAGWTESLDFPATSNSFQPFIGAGRDAFVTSLDPAGVLRYSTFLGGAGNDVAYRIAADAAGSAYVTGAKFSADFPTTPGALNRGGVFRSGDGAANWTGRGAGMSHTVVEALAFAPGGVLLAGTPRGVFASTDGGATWAVSFTSLSVNGVNTVAADPATAVLYAGTGRGLLLSGDGGATWVFESGGLGARPVHALAFTPGVIFAGTYGSGIFRSTNAAASWRTVNSGLGNLNVNVLAVHPGDATILYAATESGIYKSTNNGVNWRAAVTGLITRKTQALIIDPAAPATLYAGTSKGIFKSINAGSNWVISGTGLGSSNVLALALDPANSATLYAGTTNGLYKSTDAAATWTPASAGLVPPVVKALLVDPANPAVLYAGLRGSNSFGGSNDVFLTKLLPDGSGLAYSLAFGGRKNDQGWGVAVDAVGRAVVAGSTDSTNFPVANASLPRQTTNSGRTDVFLAQFDPAGAAMEFSLLLGGNRDDLAYALALDSTGAAYLTGRTDSTNFPSASPVQAQLAGRPDLFITKVIPQVALQVARDANRIVVSWSGPLPGYALEGTEDMHGPWTSLPAPTVFKDGRSSVTLPAASAGRFFRLKSARP